MNKTVLENYIKKQIGKLIQEENENDPLFFAVKIRDLGTVLVSAKSQAQVLTQVAKKLRNGKKDIVSIYRVEKSKGNKAMKLTQDKEESVQRF